MKLDKESTVSLYIQLMHVIKEQIHNGIFGGRADSNRGRTVQDV